MARQALDQKTFGFQLKRREITRRFLMRFRNDRRNPQNLPNR
jgi:hypothetical protein